MRASAGRGAGKRGMMGEEGGICMIFGTCLDGANVEQKERGGGGRLERVALWSIVKIMKPKRDFSLFNWRPQTISRMTDCEIPFGSEESRSIREEEL